MLALTIITEIGKDLHPGRIGPAIISSVESERKVLYVSIYSRNY